MGVDGESEENLATYKEERERGYVNGEPLGMNPRVPEEASAELNVMRTKVPVAPPEYIGMYASKCTILVCLVFLLF